MSANLPPALHLYVPFPYVIRFSNFCGSACQNLTQLGTRQMNIKSRFVAPSASIPGRQAGYTMTGIMVAAALIGITGLITYGLLKATNDTKVTTADQILTQKFPRAILSYSTVVGCPSSDGTTDITDALARRGLKSTTVWGQPWTAKTSGTGQTAVIEVTYPVGTGQSGQANNGVADDVSTATAEMATALSNPDRYPEIASAKASGSDLTVSYLNQCQG